MVNLENKTVDELKNLAKSIVYELERRKNEIKEAIIESQSALGESKFHFEHFTSNKNNIPYVARLYYDFSKRDMEREFKKLDRTYSRSDVTVEGYYTAYEHEILEIKKGIKKYYVVLDGALVFLTYGDESNEIATIKRFLKKELELQTLLELLEVKEIGDDIIDELKD